MWLLLPLLRKLNIPPSLRTERLVYFFAEVLLVLETVVGATTHPYIVAATAAWLLLLLGPMSLMRRNTASSSLDSWLLAKNIIFAI